METHNFANSKLNPCMIDPKRTILYKCGDLTLVSTKERRALVKQRGLRELGGVNLLGCQIISPQLMKNS